MSMFCKFDRDTSLSVNERTGRIALYDGERGVVNSIMLPPDATALAVANIYEAVVHILTQRGTYVLRATATDPYLGLVFIGGAP
jgi:hypothetical protein